MYVGETHMSKFASGLHNLILDNVVVLSVWQIVRVIRHSHKMESEIACVPVYATAILNR